MYRQGDVLIVKVDNFDATTSTREKKAGKRYILAEGEATGHAHNIKSDAVVLYRSPNGQRVIVADDGFMVEHEEHAPITVPPGIYRVIRQREYSPEAIRNVAD